MLKTLTRRIKNIFPIQFALREQGKKRRQSIADKLYRAILTNNITHPLSLRFAIYERGPVRLYRTMFRNSFHCDNELFKAEKLPAKYRFCMFPYQSNDNELLQNENCRQRRNVYSPGDTFVKKQIKVEATSNDENPCETEPQNSRTLLQVNAANENGYSRKVDKQLNLKAAGKYKEDTNTNESSERITSVDQPKELNVEESTVKPPPLKSFLIDKKKAKNIKRETPSIRLKSKSMEFQTLLEEFNEIPKIRTEEDIPDYIKKENKQDSAKDLNQKVDYSNEVFVEDIESRGAEDIDQEKESESHEKLYFDFENDRFEHFEEINNELYDDDDHNELHDNFENLIDDHDEFEHSEDYHDELYHRYTEEYDHNLNSDDEYIRDRMLEEEEEEEAQAREYVDEYEMKYRDVYEEHGEFLHNEYLNDTDESDRNVDRDHVRSEQDVNQHDNGDLGQFSGF